MAENNVNTDRFPGRPHCESCIFFAPPTSSKEKRGECRHDLPSAGSKLWPKVLPADWCPEHPDFDGWAEPFSADDNWEPDAMDYQRLLKIIATLYPEAETPTREGIWDSVLSDEEKAYLEEVWVAEDMFTEEEEE